MSRSLYLLLAALAVSGCHAATTVLDGSGDSISGDRPGTTPEGAALAPDPSLNSPQVLEVSFISITSAADSVDTTLPTGASPLPASFAAAVAPPPGPVGAPSGPGPEYFVISGTGITIDSGSSADSNNASISVEFDANADTTGCKQTATLALQHSSGLILKGTFTVTLSSAGKTELQVSALTSCEVGSAK